MPLAPDNLMSGISGRAPRFHEHGGATGAGGTPEGPPAGAGAGWALVWERQGWQAGHEGLAGGRAMQEKSQAQGRKDARPNSR